MLRQPRLTHRVDRRWGEGQLQALSTPVHFEPMGACSAGIANAEGTTRLAGPSGRDFSCAMTWAGAVEVLGQVLHRCHGKCERLRKLASKMLLTVHAQN
jgi:hypothetical protein